MNKTISLGLAALSFGVGLPLAPALSQDWQGGRGGYAHGMMGGGMMQGMGSGDSYGQMRGMGSGRGGYFGQTYFLDLIEDHDTDGDGAVTQEEVDAARQDRLKEFDKDGNGQLSITEYEALWLDAMRQRMVRRFQRHDRDGDGQVTADEFGRQNARMVMMHDRTGDGRLSIEDLMGGGGRYSGMAGDRGAFRGAMPSVQGGQMGQGGQMQGGPMEGGGTNLEGAMEQGMRDTPEQGAPGAEGSPGTQSGPAPQQQN